VDPLEKFKPNKILLTGIGIFLILLSGIVFLSTKESEKMQTAAAMPEPISVNSDGEEKAEKKQIKDTPSQKVIMIDVQGSVKRPGVYEMNDGDRVIHAIKKAGGFLERADIRSVNQAQKISDEMVIYVAAKGEDFLNVNQQKEKDGKININTATVEKLEELSGVGPSKAQSIVTYREENGPFTDLEQLLDIKGIGEKTIEEWKEKIVFH
jgi:competence protein ComEA